MRRIVILNPNSSTATTAMMVQMATMAMMVQTAGYLPHPQAALLVEGDTARTGPGMITDEPALLASAAEVLRMGVQAAAGGAAGLVVSAFGDPGYEALCAAVDIPVAGLCEAGMAEAAAGGRRFGVATTTPLLAQAISRRTAALGHGALFTGVRLTAGNPLALAADPQAQTAALLQAVQQCVQKDGAQAVVIGGGPLGQSALLLEEHGTVPVIAPIGAAMRSLLRRLPA